MTKDFEFVKEMVDMTDWDDLRTQKKELEGILKSPVHCHLTEAQ